VTCDGGDACGDVHCVVNEGVSSSRHSSLNLEIESLSGRSWSGEASWAENRALENGGTLPGGWRK
jgi:hypothetical protein